MPQTPEQRKAAAAKRMREKRARERAERDAAKKAAAANAANDKPARTQRDALEQAIAAMKWLTSSDDASVAQARMLAEAVDVQHHNGDIAKELSAHRALTTVLHQLGGTPTVRLQHELRSLKLESKTGDGDGDSEGAKPPANVTKFERPAKRKRTG